MVFHSCSYPVEFFGDHSKAKFAKDLPNVICITIIGNCKARYSKSELKYLFRIIGITFNERKIRFTCIIRQFQMTLARLLSIM